MFRFDQGTSGKKKIQIVLANQKALANLATCLPFGRSHRLKKTIPTQLNEIMIKALLHSRIGLIIWQLFFPRSGSSQVFLLPPGSFSTFSTFSSTMVGSASAWPMAEVSKPADVCRKKMWLLTMTDRRKVTSSHLGLELHKCRLVLQKNGC